MSFRTQLVAAMDDQNIRQADLARMTGFSSAQIASLVTGRTKDPKLSTVLVVARALNVSLDYLAGREEEIKPLHDPSEDELVSLYRRCTPDRKRRALEDMRDRAEASVEAPGKVQGDSRRAV